MGFVLALATVALTAGAAFGNLVGGSVAPQGDSRVRMALDAAELNYTVDKDGDFRLHFTLDEGRTQLVFIDSATSNYQGIETRSVYGIAYRGLRPSAHTLSRILEDAQVKKIGKWGAVDSEETYTLIFTIDVSSECDAETLRKVVWAVAEVADQWEADLMDGSDDL